MLRKGKSVVSVDVQRHTLSRLRLKLPNRNVNSKAQRSACFVQLLHRELGKGDPFALAELIEQAGRTQVSEGSE